MTDLPAATNPTGVSFLSYRRSRGDEAARLVQALHDHGVPTWQDVRNLATVPTEDELRRILADHTTASAVIFITPEVETSLIIRNVEVVQIIRRAEAGDGFFVVPLAAGGLDYAKAAEVTSNHLSAQNLRDWNLKRILAAVISDDDAAEVATTVLGQRLQAIHRFLPQGEPLRVGFFIRKPPPFRLGVSLSIDWSPHFKDKEADTVAWRERLIPALDRISNLIRQHAPARDVDAFGIPTLPAAIAFGGAFLSTGGLRAGWRQIMPGQSEQVWNLAHPREDSGFTARTTSKEASARDIAVLVSVADDTEPVFAAFQRRLPPLRALVHIQKSDRYPHRIKSPGEAADVAYVVQEGMRAARRDYGNLGTVHLFVAAPAGIAVMIGQLLNTFGSIQTYEHVTDDGSGHYKPAAHLRPSS